MTLGELLKAKRVASGMTLQEVGDACGISKGHLYDLERDSYPNPGLFTCTRLSVALGINVQAMAAACLESNTSERSSS